MGNEKKRESDQDLLDPNKKREDDDSDLEDTEEPSGKSDKETGIY